MPTPGVEVRDLEIPVELEQRNRQTSEGAAGRVGFKQFAGCMAAAAEIPG